MRKKPIEKQQLKIYRPGDTSVVLPMFINKVACGLPTDVGDPTAEEVDLLDYFGLKNGATLMVEAQGDSMLPDVSPGDVMFINTADKPQNGDTVLAFLDDEALIKKFYYNKENRKVRLVPVNGEFAPLEVSNNSRRLVIQGVVKFIVRKMERQQLRQVTVKGAKQPKKSEKKTSAPTPPAPSQSSILNPQSSILLHQLIDGKKGKAVALAIYCAAQLGLITQTDYNAVSEEFGDIGSRQNYYKYLSNPQRFTPIEVEMTKSFLTQNT